MKVLTRTEPMLEEFGEAVVSALRVPLSHRVGVVGVPSGGLLLADIVRRAYVRHGHCVHYSQVAARRPSTSLKRAHTVARLISAIIRLLPIPIQDKLRVLEHRLLSTRRTPHRTVSACESLAGLSECDCVIVVDDAIDSGHSMQAVCAFLTETLQPRSMPIYVAVYVVTQGSPVIEPDVAMFRGVLVRFPWSTDAA